MLQDDRMDGQGVYRWSNGFVCKMYSCIFDFPFLFLLSGDMYKGQFRDGVDNIHLVVADANHNCRKDMGVES